jgi:predicted nucleic acid-binding protein
LRLCVDSAALYALLDREHVKHRSLADAWRQLADGTDEVLAHSYSIAEAVGMIHRWLPRAAIPAFFDDLLAPVKVIWVDERLHEAAVAALMVRPDKALTLSDWVTYRIARQHRAVGVLALDDRFRFLGLAQIPQ